MTDSSKPNTDNDNISEASEPPPRDHWVGFDLGGTKMLAAILNQQFEVVARERKRTKGYRGATIGLARMIQAIKDALEEANLQPDRIAGIGVACPGPLNLEKGVILDAPNLGWRRVPVKKKLEAEFGCPVHICNDVDAGVYGEYRFGAGRDSRCLIGVFPGTGIGGGCVFKGELFTGRNSSCFEIGHMPFIPSGPICGCGTPGHLEAVASRLAISSAASAAAYRGDAPNLLENCGTDIANIRSGALRDSIAAGDITVEKIVRQAAQHLGAALSGIIHLLSPDTIVLGGGLVEAMPEIYLTEITKTVRQNLMPAFLKTYTILPAKLGDDASVKGAAAWAQHQSQQST